MKKLKGDRLRFLNRDLDSLKEIKSKIAFGLLISKLGNYYANIYN